MLVEITKATVANGEDAAVGQKVEVSETEGRLLKAMGRAVDAKLEPKTAPKPAAKQTKATKAK